MFFRRSTYVPTLRDLRFHRDDWRLEEETPQSLLWITPQGDAVKLWRCVAETMLRRLSGRPLWLSTAGAGVAWLHVRVDPVPKYYAYPPYRVAPACD